MNIDKDLNALETYFQQSPVAIVCAYLFGSYARGEPRRRSDIDIAVLFPEEGRTEGLSGPAATLRGDLERLLRREVDLVDMRSAPVDLIHRVLRDGRLLVERDAGERVRFEVDARNRYFDLLPHLERYRQRQTARLDR